MAKQTSPNSIRDFNDSWSLDTRNNLPYPGSAVETFLKTQLIDALTSRFGYVEFDSNNMRLDFYDEEGGTKLGTAQLGGDIYTISVDSSVPQVFYILADEATKNITITPSTTVSPFGSTTQTPYPEAYTYVVAVNTGGGYVTRITGNINIGGSATFDIRPYLATGDNYIRLSVTGVSSGQTRTIVFTGTLTTLSMSCNHTWETVWLQGEDYIINGIRFVGALQKTLHIAIDGTEIDTVDYSPSESYSTIATTYTIDSSYFTFQSSGIHAVSLWMTASGVSTPVISFNIMCAADEDTSAMVAINAIAPSAVNYTSGRLFSYAVYNADKVTFDLAATLNSVVYPIAQGIAITNVEPGFKYDFAYQLEVDTGANETALGTIAYSSTAYNGAIQGNTFTASSVFDNTYSYISFPGALFYMNAATRSNGTSDYLMINNEMGASENFAASYSADWDGFSFSSDAWVTDKQSHKALYVPAGSSLDITNFRPLQYLASYPGMTIEMMIQSANPSDYDTPVLTMANNDLGIYIYPTKIVVYGSNEGDEVSQSVVLDENRMIHLTITFTKDYGGITARNLCSIYVNGISNVNFSFSGTSGFGSGNLYIGQNDTDFYLYKMRVYGIALEANAVFNNFLNCIFDGVEFNRRQEFNKNAVTDNNAIDYDLCKAAGYNIMVVTMDDDSHPLPSVNNDTKYLNCKMRFEYAENSAYNVEVANVELDGQGTTSKKYYRWNLRAKTNNETVWSYGDGTNSTGKTGKIINLNTYIGVDRITAKKNYASSMQGHKMGMTGLYNDLFKQIGLGSELPNEDYRVAVYQFPFVGFLYHPTNNTYEYIGLYTAGPDKGSKVTFGYNKTAHPNLLALEGPNHDPAGTRFLTPWVDVTYDHNDETFMFGGEEAWDCRYVKWEKSSEGTQQDWDNILALYNSEWKPAYECVFNNSPYLVSASELITALNDPNITTLADLLTVANAPTIRLGVTNGYKNDLLCFYDTNYELYFYRRIHSKFEKLADVDSTLEHNVVTPLVNGGYLNTNSPTTSQIVDARAARFKATIGNYFSVQQTLFHYAFCIFFGVTDNFAKNTYPRKFELLSSSATGNRWGWDQDDLDTVLATDNNGRSTKKYSVEHGDLNSSGNEIFNGGDAVLWVMIRDNYVDEVRTMMQSIVSAVNSIASAKGISGTSPHSTFFNVVSYYCWQQSAKYFAEVMYEKDKEWSYLTPWLIDPSKKYNDVFPLDQALGDQFQAERIWVDRRIAYMFSKYRLGAFTGTNTTDYSGISMTLAGQFTFNITPAIDLYPVVSVASTDYPVSSPTRTEAGQIKQITVPAGGNSNNYIHGVDWFASLGDLSNMVLTDRGADTNISFSVQAARMQTLKVGDGNPSIVVSPDVYYTQDEVDEYNLTLDGAIEPDTVLTAEQATLVNEAISTTYAESDIISIEDANAYNATLTGAISTSDIKIPEVRRVPFNATALAVDSPTLTTLDARYTYTVRNEVSLLNCPRLQSILFEGSSATGLILPVGARLQEVSFPAGAKLVFMHSLPFLTEEHLSLPALSGITRLYVNNCKYINALSVLKQIMDSGSDSLEYITLIWSGTQETTEQQAEALVGIIDKDGYVDYSDGNISVVAGIPYIEGTIAPSTFFSISDVNALRDAYEHLVIDASDSKLYVKFADENVESIALANWGTDGVVTIQSAKAVTSLPTTTGTETSFRGNTSIETFNELQYFTGLTRIWYSGAGTNSSGPFTGCTNLREVTFPDTVTALGLQVFKNCTSLQKVSNCKVTEFGQGCFIGCTSLTEIDLSRATTIGLSAFESCSSLNIDLNVPNLTSIGKEAFRYGNLKKITSLGSITSIPSNTANYQGCFRDNTALTEVVLPETLTSIGAQAFSGCTSLTTINFPASVTVIGASAFMNCPIQGDVALQGVTNIDISAFRQTAIESVTMPSIVTIQYYGTGGANSGVFRSCHNLHSVDVGESCATINQYAFYDCPKFAELTVRALTPPTLAANAITITATFSTIFVPASAMDDYRAASNWSVYYSYFQEIGKGPWERENGFVANTLMYLTDGSVSNRTSGGACTTTPFIPIPDGCSTIKYKTGLTNTSYNINGSGKTLLANFYDFNKGHVSYITQGSYEYTDVSVPSGAKYFKMTMAAGFSGLSDYFCYVLDVTHNKIIWPFLTEITD